MADENTSMMDANILTGTKERGIEHIAGDEPDRRVAEVVAGRSLIMGGKYQ